MDNVENPLTAWFRELLRGPVASRGRYFETLARSVESSAPLCGGECS
jgi:hypothetical protein